MSAGATQIDMLSFIGPKGYLGDTSTCGRFFSLGGVYLNPSTFGGWFNKTRLASTVIAVRVLHANGTIAIYNETKNDNSVRPFQGSMGLLGIVTALEIKLRKDTGLLMTIQQLDMNHDTYSVNKVKSFTSNIVLNNDGATFYYFGRIDTLLADVMNYNGNPNFDPITTIDWYNNAQNNGEYQKPASMPEYSVKYATILAGISPLYGRIFQTYAIMKSLIKMNQEQAITPNDGHSSSFSVPYFEQVSHFIHCQSVLCIDDASILVDVTRKFMRQNVYNDKRSRFLDIAFVYRIFIVRDNDLLLFDHFKQPGHYIGCEIQAIKRQDRMKYSYTLKQIEDLWHITFPNGTTVHHGKAYGYGPILNTTMSNGKERPIEQNEWIPFQNVTIASAVYSNETRKLFIQYMDQYDPNGTFRAGSALHLLGLTTETYTVKQYNNEECYDGTTRNGIVTSATGSCKYNKNIGCFSNCCDNSHSLSFLSMIQQPSFDDGICRERNSVGMGNACTNDCDCDPNAKCRTTLSSLTSKRCATTFFS